VTANGQRVIMYGGVYQDTVYFLVKWRDYHQNKEHIPYVWNGKEYRKDYKNMEDGFSLNFDFKGEYASCMLYGSVYQCDIWYWKSARTAPAGLALDGVMRFDGHEFPGAEAHSSHYGKPLYIGFINDAGTPVYSQQTYDKHTRDHLPQYRINKNASGSIADVKAVGKWKKIHWILEMSRKLNTGHPDDRVFELGKSYHGAIAVYDSEEGQNHSVSRTINFVFPK
ncbi:MAG: ethylbenzene dehydrogenase-related protein, partial [bacterium]